MKAGVIGAGTWGMNLVRVLDSLGALGGVAEIAPAARDRIAASYPAVPLHPDHRALLVSDAQAVVIATPAPTHYQMAREALIAGKDVFVEKPITLRADEADDLAQLAEDHGRVLMAGHLLLYQPAVRWISDFIAKGGLGTLYSLHQERLNLGRARHVENALWSLGVHDVAVLLHLIGESPERVLATGQRALGRVVEDDVHLHLEFPFGAHAHLHVSWLWPERRRRLTLIGSLGMLVYDELAQSVTLHRKTIGGDLSNQDGGSEVVHEGHAEPLNLEMEHFLECVRHRSRPISDGRSAAQVTRVIEEAQSQLEGR